MKQIHLLIYGKVQGVWYRASTKQFVDHLNSDIKGFVRNCADGSVEVIAEGQESELEKIIEFCKQGPQFARVDDIKIVWNEAEGRLDQFEVAR